jgi:hypothetical protein
MFTKSLQFEVLGIHIIILFFYKSKYIFESSLSKDFHFYSFLSSRCLWEQFIFAFVWNRQPTKGPVKFYSFLASVVHCVQNRFTILLAWSYISKFTLGKTFIFTVFPASVALCGQNQHIFKNSHSFPAPAVQCAQNLFLFLLSLKHTWELIDTNFFSFK